MKTHDSLSLVLWLLTCVIVLGVAPSAFAGQGFDVKLVNVFGSSGTEPGQFNFPLGITVNSQDKIIIADAENNRIQICDHAGNCDTFGRSGTRGGRFRNPHGVAVDSQDWIYTVETGNTRVQVFDDTGNWIRMFGDWGAALGQFKTPGDIAIDNQGRVLVADEQNYRVQICSGTGQCTAFGSKGNAPGEFDWPRAVVVDSDDTIIVMDQFNHRVQLCDEKGGCEVFGSLGSEPGSFDEPVEVALDGRERIIIADLNNHRIQVCDRQGDCWAFGSFGSGPGEFINPRGVAVDSHGHIIVSDNGNNRIQIFEVDYPFLINPGLNDAWFNPETDGQGFFITVLPELNLVSLAWFTYDTELPAPDAPANLGDAGHRWITALGPIAVNKVSMLVDITSGGIFDMATDIQHTNPQGSDGTIILTFDDCNSGTIEYDMPSINRQGAIPIQRITDDNIKICEALSAH